MNKSKPDLKHVEEIEEDLPSIESEVEGLGKDIEIYAENNSLVQNKKDMFKFKTNPYGFEVDS